MTMAETKKAKGRESVAGESIADRIGEMLAMYEMLNGEANRLIDQYVDEVAAPRCPGIPKSVVRALEIDNRIGGMLNYPEALRFLRQVRA